MKIPRGSACLHPLPDKVQAESEVIPWIVDLAWKVLPNGHSLASLYRLLGNGVPRQAAGSINFCKLLNTSSLLLVHFNSDLHLLWRVCIGAVLALEKPISLALRT